MGRHHLASLALSTICGCSAPQQYARRGAPEVPPPPWVTNEAVSSEEICGLGVAGAGYDASSPYPRELSSQRAITNLAGSLSTEVQEAIIDTQDSRDAHPDVQLDRVLHVDDALVAQVSSAAKVEFWLDVAGVGPYGQKNFTYAHACLQGAALQQLQIDPRMLSHQGHVGSVNPDQVPRWVTWTGHQRGGRVCAVGYSEPAFFADQTFQNVVEDVRGQLAQVVQTLVSSYCEEASNGQGDVAQQMLVASTQSVSHGVVVTHFWHDPRGIGPNKTKLGTYGWGCVYPVDALRSAMTAAAQQMPDNRDKIAQVRSRAESAFANLDAEEAKRAAPQPAAAVAQDGGH